MRPTDDEIIAVMRRLFLRFRPKVGVRWTIEDAMKYGESVLPHIQEYVGEKMEKNPLEDGPPDFTFRLEPHSSEQYRRYLKELLLLLELEDPEGFF